ncbi:NAD(P)-binding domain-containing protein [Streptomyces sp. Je 1-4]|uniref:NAD(P)-binding domain-containing protein n=1 Tax=Streptomyces TaxID=1883 RepID=UPI0021D95FFC|nr:MULTISPECIES: NAD(P)-binding domain-containing protein [unclassified Streptomyces]UYB42285.1 NAD(P)-binding domain-containing protein [Streptomyces sp. Je 1-4]UZQ38581.1 NAD(P)-binding domain-containing protein [Streptomyces sp. Je 1-4] [Streptomyces sp. Je 1-4 4N24]UZQ45998.1 NAD(P)-binding domain-containing protein [Streptomyces sp. Je 1-4] [Streptomyces sp. Je 1-4 4N24_ara]
MYDLVVVGAGPYGLSIAAHAAAAGLRLRVLGRPMASWRDHMPDGMLLKSEPWSTDLSDPAGGHTLADYCAAHELTAEHGVPLPLDTFAAYGRWFGERAVPQVEEVTVTAVRPDGDGFHVETDTGEQIPARTVALALGVMPFVNRPWPLLELPPELASHSSDHRDLRRFSGQDVTVLGSGQSALETATLLAEQGARPRLVARADHLRWNAPPQPLARGRLRALRDPHSGLGTGWPNWLWSKLPGTVRRLPSGTRVHIAENALGPAGAWWLRERFEPAVPVLLSHRVRAAAPQDDGVRLHLTHTDGRTETLDTQHVVAATGFTPDLGRLRLLPLQVRTTLRTVGGSRAPELSSGFESSWPGLFFAGLLTAPSFGPSMRFVYGAGFTAARLLRGVQRRLGDRRGATTIPRPARDSTPAAH